MIRLTSLVLACSVGLSALAAETIVRNPDFEQDADSNGVPDEWRWSGDSRLVDQSLTIDTGRDDGRCARLNCTRFEAGNPAAHAMVCQLDVPVRRGVGYRLAFWAKADQLAAGTVSIALSDTSVWANCGLQDSFVPTSRWARYEFVFRATRDCAKGSRFQIWFLSTGTLWIDDVGWEEAGEHLYRPGTIVAAPAATNLVPNASFECGPDGWGSAEWDRQTHWGGPMNGLFGCLDDQHAADGRCSWRIDLSPETAPVSCFDYYELHRRPILAPLVGNQGYLQLDPQPTYTLSVYLKAAEDGTPALLAVRDFEGRSQDKSVTVSTDWQRYQMQFRPRSPWCFVLAGPDLRATSDRPHPRQRATLWIDAFQLEAADTATDFSPRSPLELGISTDQVGNVFDWNEPQRIQLSVHVRDNGETGFEQSKTGTPARLLGETSTVTDVSDRRLNDGQECPSCLVCGPASCQDSPAGLDQVRVEMRISDLFDRDVWNGTTVPDASGSATVEIPACDQLRGYLRVHATAKCGDLVCQRSMAMAAIPVHHADDSRFGVNHAYPWPHLLDLCRRAGLVWVRDWSAKWQDIEPEPGRFSFDEVDYQIDRPRKHDLQVLGLVPFPSSRWSSSAPEGVGATDRYPDNRRRVAYAPRDVAPFENFVARIVEHYRGRIAWWQVFNEPLFTDYSLPRDAGYDGQDYARWTIAFAQAARRASPDTKILAGIGYLNDGQILDDFRQFFEAGGLAAIDAVDIHHYPRIRPPEFIEEPLAKLGALMETCGGRKPIWLTEYGYYADDEPWSTPMPHSGFDQPLPSELVQCEYAVRWAAILFAGGADKIFYHAGTCDGLNRDSLQGIFFEYGGTPHKIYAVQAVMSHLLTARSQFVKRLHFDPATRAYLFRDEARLVCVLWSTAAEQGRSIQLSDDRIQLLDLAGRTQQGRTVVTSETPVYLVAEGLTSEQFAAAVQ